MYNPKNSPQKAMQVYYEAFGDSGLELLWLNFNGYTSQAEHLFKSLCSLEKELGNNSKTLNKLYSDITSL